MENQVFQYNGNNITFQIGNGDVMVNATEMAKPFGKRAVDYLRLPSTKQLIDAIVGKSHFEESQLVTTIRGGLNPSTWIHEDIALDFAQWLSVDFKLWCNDRVKEIMKHGFTATEPKLEELANNPDLLISLASNLKQERAEKERLKEMTHLQEKELKELAPKVEYYDEVLQSDSEININQIAKELGMSAMALNKKLKEMHIQYFQGDQWLLYAKFQDKAYTKTDTHPYKGKDGTIKTRIRTVWTEKGRQFIHSLFKTQKVA